MSTQNDGNLSTIAPGFSQRAKEAMKAIFPKQDENEWAELIAMDLNIRQDYAKRVIMGWMSPSRRFAKKLAKFTRARLEYLLTGEGEMFDHPPMSIEDSFEIPIPYENFTYKDFENYMSKQLGMDMKDIKKWRGSVRTQKLYEIYRSLIKIQEYINMFKDEVDQEIEERENSKS